MIIHFHFSPNPNSGEIRRIRNINNELCEVANTKCVEVEFYSLRDRMFVQREWRFNLTNNVIRKYYIPLFPFTGKSRVLQWICDVWTSLCIFIIYLRHHSNIIVGEYSTSYSAMLFKRFMRCLYIADMHGALAEEYTYNNPNILKWKLEYITKREKQTSQKADYIICQSEEMKRHITNKYSANNDNVYVYKCGVNTKLFICDEDIKVKMRERLNIPKNCIVFVYAGGLMKWQKIEESLQIFSRIHQTVNNSRFLILTRELDTVKTLLCQLKLEYLSEMIIALSSPFDKVSDYLNAADVAFLLRDDDVMNRVASPTKLAEYMACGLPVISSKVALCWVDKKLVDDNTIICYEEGMPLQDLINIIKLSDGKKIRSHAENTFSLAIDSQNIVKMFNNIKSK